MKTPVTLDLERELLASHAGQILVGLDEVGRGAWAGPMCVGAVAVTAAHAAADAPDGLADSKDVRESRRVALVPQIAAWALTGAVGEATSTEVDTLGVTAALRLAGQRALAALRLERDADVLLLDGPHDYLTDPWAGSLFDDTPTVPVHCQIKADATCGSVAAASILAKVHHDTVMRALHAEHPLYGWDRNVGYASPDHITAVHQHGLSPHHRQSWHVPSEPATVDAAPCGATAGASLSDPSETLFDVNRST